MSSVKENIEKVRERVARAAEKAGRDAGRITIVAVSKRFGPEKVVEAIEAGIEDIGENRVQEFLEKSAKVALPCRWHLIGHLQTNKVKRIIDRFVMIHSVDSVHLAERMDRAAEAAHSGFDILLEVNTSGEESKYGFDPAEVEEAVHSIAQFPHVHLKGLMTVGPLTDDVRRIAESFARLRTLRDDIARNQIEGVSMEHLSMGMTDDFEIAVAEGSTILRIGRAIFGERG